MNCSVKPFFANGVLTAVPSKSHAHRLLIMSAFSKGKTIIYNVGSSEDVYATANCLNSLGAKVEIEDGNATVVGAENIPNIALLDCGESGSTLRFLMPVCSALGVTVTFTGRGKLLTRPNDKLIEVLTSHGVSVNGFTHSGVLRGGNFDIDASVSSQYVTGLILASVLTGEDCKIKLMNGAVSKSYINITLKAVKSFGIEYTVENDVIEIKGGQKFTSPKFITAEGDWSSAAFPLVLGAINGKVTVKGLFYNSEQGDKVIIDLLKRAGVKLRESENSFTAEKSQIKAVEFDAKDCPDTVPIVSTLLAFAKGTSTIKNVERLKIKESNRLEAIIDNLKRAGISAKTDGKNLYIQGGEPKSNEFLGYNDHRIVMSAVVLAIGASGSSTVTNSSAVKKSYPEFFNDINKLGGEDYVRF